jgi:hypothetical protein
MSTPTLDAGEIIIEWNLPPDDIDHLLFESGQTRPYRSFREESITPLQAIPSYSDGEAVGCEEVVPSSRQLTINRPQRGQSNILSPRRRSAFQKQRRCTRESAALERHDDT